MGEKVITVDQSFTHTAWIVWEGDEVLDFGVINSNKDDIIYKRAEDIAKVLVKKVNEHEPSVFIIEQMAFSAMGNAMKNLAGLLFVICVAIKRGTHLGYDDMVFPTPTGAKKAMTGKGRATKQEILAAVPEDVVKLLGSKYKKTKGLYDLADCVAFKTWYDKQ